MLSFADYKDRISKSVHYHIENNIPFAREHLDVIKRFGRFPNRNQALKRKSTKEELSFLAAGGVKWDSSKDTK